MPNPPGPTRSDARSRTGPAEASQSAGPVAAPAGPPAAPSPAPPSEGSDPAVRTERLAEYLRALGNPKRLELLHELRTPRAVSEIVLHPDPQRGPGSAERAMSHQAVRDHLAKLRAIGVIAVERTEQDGSVVDHFVLNHPKLFAIVEELRALGELRTQADPPPAQPTIGAEPPAPQRPDTGPRFLLVRGQGEGRVFPLRKEMLGVDRGWVVGRKRGLAVSLDYDPFVSTENAEVLLDGAGFRLLDMRSSRNGTLLNYRPLPKGGSAPLANGDVVTVGKTSLVFRVG